jgi:hypothetical protein
MTDLHCRQRQCANRLDPRAGTSESGHFETKAQAASLLVYWSGPPTRADVLHLAFVLNNALGSPTCPTARQRQKPAVDSHFKGWPSLLKCWIVQPSGGFRQLKLPRKVLQALGGAKRY